MLRKCVQKSGLAVRPYHECRHWVVSQSSLSLIPRVFLIQERGNEPGNEAKAALSDCDHHTLTFVSALEARGNPLLASSMEHGDVCIQQWHMTTTISVGC